MRRGRRQPWQRRRRAGRPRWPGWWRRHRGGVRRNRSRARHGAQGEGERAADGQADGLSRKQREDGNGPRGLSEKRARDGAATPRGNMVEEGLRLGPDGPRGRDREGAEREQQLVARLTAIHRAKVVMARVALLHGVEGVTNRVARAGGGEERIEAGVAGLNVDDARRARSVEPEHHEVRALGQGLTLRGRGAPLSEGTAVVKALADHAL